MSTWARVLDWLTAAGRPAPMPPKPGPAPGPEPTGDVTVVALPRHGDCTCGCVALLVRNAHLEDKVTRLTEVLAAGGGSIRRGPADADP